MKAEHIALVTFGSVIVGLIVWCSILTYSVYKNDNDDNTDSGGNSNTEKLAMKSPKARPQRMSWLYVDAPPDSNVDSNANAQEDARRSRGISAEEQNFPFKKVCQFVHGATTLRNPASATDPFDGTLLACSLQTNYGNPETVLFSELAEIQALIRNGSLKPRDERERLVTYFRIVYPEAPAGAWERMPLDALQNYYQSLEFYYKLPAEIMPQTKVVARRPVDQSFYQVPAGVMMDQDPNRLGETSPYIEVVRFGNMFSPMRDPTLFNGSYYYPVRGSGLYIPVGRCLISYNKIHALKQLGVYNSEIVPYAGRDFQSFLQQYSKAMWADVVKQNPGADKKTAWVNTCVVDKHATDATKSGDCKPVMGWQTKPISYFPPALDRMIAEMVSGKSLRMASRKQPDGTMRDVKVYYGGGDTLDRFLGQIARDRGYDTLQFLREAQMALAGDAIVGNEIVKLEEGLYAQAEYVRLNPFNQPYLPPYNPHTEASVQYLLDGTIDPVAPRFVAASLYTPYTEDASITIDVVVPKRNDNDAAPVNVKTRTRE